MANTADIFSALKVLGFSTVSFLGKLYGKISDRADEDHSWSAALKQLAGFLARTSPKVVALGSALIGNQDPKSFFSDLAQTVGDAFEGIADSDLPVADLLMEIDDLDQALNDAMEDDEIRSLGQEILEQCATLVGFVLEYIIEHDSREPRTELFATWLDRFESIVDVIYDRWVFPAFDAQTSDDR